MGSIPHMAFIECDPIPFQQPQVFILKRHLPVMLRLVPDVSHDRIRIGLADRECTVARLQVEIRELSAFGFDPFGRTGFHRLDHLGNGSRARQAGEEMNMVFHTADLQ